ncbi:MAG: hypothetical protein RLT05_10440 [Bauldia litoralis]
MIGAILTWLFTRDSGRAVLLVLGIATLGLGAWGAKALYDRAKRTEGRQAERNERLRDHVEAIENGRLAEADAGSGSDRDRRLRDKYRRD